MSAPWAKHCSRRCSPLPGRTGPSWLRLNLKETGSAREGKPRGRGAVSHCFGWRHHQDGVATDPPTRQGSPWPRHPARGSCYPRFIWEMHGTPVILSRPWRTPGLPSSRSAPCPRAEAPSCHRPAAQLQLKNGLQRTGAPLLPPQTQKYLAANPNGGEGRGKS